MQWLHSTQRRIPFQSRRSAWTSAGSPHSESWQWPERPSGGLLIQVRPLEAFWVARETSHSMNPEPGQDPSAGGGGSPSAWRGLEDHVGG